MESPHLDFYMEHGISPVRVDISDMDAHLARRRNLYMSLGVPPSAFRGADILEVAPGSGTNSLYPASCLPNSFVMSEPNPIGRQHIADLYGDRGLFSFPITDPQVVHSKLENFSSSAMYDIVICECWLGGSDDDLKQIKKLGTHLRPGGTLIITCQPPAGALFTMLRRLLVPRLVDMGWPIERKVQELRLAFNSHLSTLDGMTRSYDDWVMDTLLNPAPLTDILEPQALIWALGWEDYEVLGSAPRFGGDWAWYKRKEWRGESVRRFQGAYCDFSHNFVDQRLTREARLPASNGALTKACMALVEVAARAADTDDEWLDIDGELVPLLGVIRENLYPLSYALTAALDEFQQLWSQGQIITEEVARMKHFKYAFGRELLHMALVKNG